MEHPGFICTSSSRIFVAAQNSEEFKFPIITMILEIDPSSCPVIGQSSLSFFLECLWTRIVHLCV